MKQSHAVAGLAEDMRGRLVSVFERYPAIEAVYLFGSVATGRARPGSDLALGLWAPAPSTDERLGLLTDLVRVGFEDVNAVYLKDADPIVQYEAVRLNEVVYATPGFHRGTVYSNVVRRYLDIKYYLDRQRARFKERMLDGSG